MLQDIIRLLKAGKREFNRVDQTHIYQDKVQRLSYAASAVEYSEIGMNIGFQAHRLHLVPVEDQSTLERKIRDLAKLRIAAGLACCYLK